MRSTNSISGDADKAALESVKSRAADLWGYLKTTDRESKVSDFKDAWLLWQTMAKVYSDSSKVVLKRGPRIISDLKQYPWLWQVSDLRPLFRAVKGRKGAYRRALLKIMELSSTRAGEYFLDVLSNPDRVVYVQSAALGLMELCSAMGLIPYLDMALPVFSVMLKPGSMEEYLDFAESIGVPADACSLARSAQGMLFKGHAPEAGVIVGNSMCEGQVNSSLIYSKIKNIPSYIFDAPNNYRGKRAKIWEAKEMARLVEWLEENTPGKMDWDRLRELLEERNRANEAEMELWEMMRQKPAPLAAEVIVLSHLIGATMLAGTREASEMFRTLAECARENMEKGIGAVAEERYRAAIWHPAMTVHWNIYRYLELKWGVAVVQESMAYNDLGFIDTSSKESMLREIGRHVLNTPMANIARGPAEYYLDALSHVIDQWDLNLILVGNHIGCKSTSAMIGILRDRCRAKGIPVINVPYDLMDSRFASWEDVTNAFDQFMETVMKDEPLMKEVSVI